MKRFLILLMCFVTFIPSMSGCSIFNSNKTVTQIELQDNIEFFVKIATRVTLRETNPVIDDLNLLRTYLLVGRDLLGSESGDLASLRDLVGEMLPEQYHVFAFTVVDVIERYVRTHIDSQDEDLTKRNKLIQAGLNGAIDAIDEYVSLKSE